MIFQEPMTSLNPAFTIGDQIMEAIRAHGGLRRSAARAKALEILREVRIPAPERRLDEYPHRLSGGMRQRVMIAIAIACRPRLLIADEPTTALDVTIQAQILDLLRRLQHEYGDAILMISHNLGVIAEIADDVAVMYAGRIVERGRIRKIFDSPGASLHGGAARRDATCGDRKHALRRSRVTVPIWTVLTRCAFAPRCPLWKIPAYPQSRPCATSLSARHRLPRAPLEQIA